MGIPKKNVFPAFRMLMVRFFVAGIHAREVSE
jgi:hypothetical protein